MSEPKATSAPVKAPPPPPPPPNVQVRGGHVPPAHTVPMSVPKK